MKMTIESTLVVTTFALVAGMVALPALGQAGPTSYASSYASSQASSEASPPYAGWPEIVPWYWFEPIRLPEPVVTRNEPLVERRGPVNGPLIQEWNVHRSTGYARVVPRVH